MTDQTDPKMTGGYEGEDKSHDSVPPPSEVVWRVELRRDINPHKDEPHIYATFVIDGQPCGMIRLPNMEYLKHLRARVHHDKSKEHVCEHGFTQPHKLDNNQLCYPGLRAILGTEREDSP